MLDALFQVASPATLASLIADIQCMGTGVDLAHRIIERKAWAALRPIVGYAEAEQMVTDLVNKAYAAEAN